MTTEQITGAPAPSSTGASTSDSIGDLAAALALAQGEIRGAPKARTNTFFKADYADLAAVWDACRAPLAKNGLAVIQVPQIERPGEVVLETVLAHKSGQWVRSRYPIAPTKNDPQGLGSAITYARRYALAAIVGVVAIDEDDDGEAAQGRGGRFESVAGRQTPPSGPSEDSPSVPPEVAKLHTALRARMTAAKTLAELDAVAAEIAKAPQAALLRPAFKARRGELQQAGADASAKAEAKAAQSAHETPPPREPGDDLEDLDPGPCSLVVGCTLPDGHKGSCSVPGAAKPAAAAPKKGGK